MGVMDWFFWYFIFYVTLFNRPAFSEWDSFFLFIIPWLVEVVRGVIFNRGPYAKYKEFPPPLLPLYQGRPRANSL